MKDFCLDVKVLGFLFFGLIIAGWYIFLDQENKPLSEYSLATVLTSVGGKIEECSEIPPPNANNTQFDTDSTQIEPVLESITDTFTGIRDEAIIQTGDSVVIRQKRSQLQQMLKNRKQAFVDRMRKDPEGALSQVLKDEDIQTARSITKNCVEERNFVEGRISMIHIDDFEGGKQTNTYYLDTDNKKRITLYPAGGMPSSVPMGSRVKIGGYAVGSEMLFDGGMTVEDLAPNETGISIAALAVVAPPTERRIVVLTAKFQDQTTPAPSNENAKNLIFTWADNFFKEESYGKVTLKGDVFGPVVLPVGGQNNCHTINPQIIDSSFQLSDPLIDYSKYTDIVVVVDYPAYCGRYFGGSAVMNKVSYSEMQEDYGFALVPYGQAGNAYVAHELGHILGSPHDNFSYCKAPLLCTAKGDHPVEYGNEYSTMASGKGHFSAANKKNIGFLEGSNILAVAQSGRYDIAPLESQDTSLPRALEIPRYQDNPLYLEYRQPIGRDAIFSSWYPGTSDVFAGALITDGNYLIDPTPSPAPKAKFSALKIGDVFTDPINGTRISVISKDTTKLTADVQLGPVGDIEVRFTSPAPSRVQEFRNPTTIKVSVDATVPIGRVKRVEFAVDSRQNIVATDTAAPYERNINVKKLPAGRHSIYATAYDEFGYSSYSKVRIDIIR